MPSYAAQRESRLLWFEPYAHQCRRLPKFRLPRIWRLVPSVANLLFGTAVTALPLGLALKGMGLIGSVGTVYLYLMFAWVVTGGFFVLIVPVGYIIVLLIPAEVRINRDGIILEKPSELLTFDRIIGVVVTLSVSGGGKMEITTNNSVRIIGVPVGADLTDLKAALGEKLVVKMGGPSDGRTDSL